jgi:class 3 adenylate cyclase
MLSGSRLKTMLGLVRRAALPINARANGEAMLGEGTVSRRPVPIIAADAAGYLRLMEADEEGMLARFKSQCHVLIDPKIALHRGRALKATRDGMLVEFANAVESERIAAE